MNGFSDKVKQKLGYYVYALADPRDNKIFYIGKGINNRIFQHEEKLDNSKNSEIEVFYWHNYSSMIIYK